MLLGHARALNLFAHCNCKFHHKGPCLKRYATMRARAVSCSTPETQIMYDFELVMLETCHKNTTLSDTQKTADGHTQLQA